MTSTPAGRKALLSDPALESAVVAELRSLLAHAAEAAHAEASGAAFLDPPAAPLLAGALNETANDAGRQLGPWGAEGVETGRAAAGHRPAALSRAAAPKAMGRAAEWPRSVWRAR